MIERFVHILFFENKELTLLASVAFYLSIMLLINAGNIAQGARRARAFIRR